MLEKYPLFKVLNVLLNRAGPRSVREMARQARISPSAAKGVLDWLFKSKILRREIIGRTYQYSLTADYFLTKHIKTLHILFEIARSGIVEELISKYPLLSVTLYGSVARGEAGPQSDIDLLLIARKETKFTGAKAAGRLKREVNYLVYTFAEWKEKARKDRIFYDRLIIDAIPLHGEVPAV